MAVIRWLLLIVSFGMAMLGFIFLMAADVANSANRRIVGFMFLGLGLFLFLIDLMLFIVKMMGKANQSQILQQKVEVSGDVHLESIKCKQCAATLSSTGVTVAAGAVFVKCPYCGSQYQIEEEPRW